MTPNIGERGEYRHAILNTLTLLTSHYLATPHNSWPRLHLFPWIYFLATPPSYCIIRVGRVRLLRTTSRIRYSYCVHVCTTARTCHVTTTPRRDVGYKHGTETKLECDFVSRNQN